MAVVVAVVVAIVIVTLRLTVHQASQHVQTLVATPTLAMAMRAYVFSISV